MPVKPRKPRAWSLDILYISAAYKVIHNVNDYMNKEKGEINLLFLN